jgi:hypothetical protein
MRFTLRRKYYDRLVLPIDCKNDTIEWLTRSYRGLHRAHRASRLEANVPLDTNGLPKPEGCAPQGGVLEPSVLALLALSRHSFSKFVMNQPFVEGVMFHKSL